MVEIIEAIRKLQTFDNMSEINSIIESLKKWEGMNTKQRLIAVLESGGKYSKEDLQRRFIRNPLQMIYYLRSIGIPIDWEWQNGKKKLGRAQLRGDYKVYFISK